jgi:protein arginine kinase activator
MLCQICQKRVGNVHITKVINNNKVEMYICEQCARENGQFSFGLPININDFFNGIIGMDSASQFISKSNPLVCEKCGMSYEEFQKVGKVGCENCYNLYGVRLDPLIKRLHGSLTHNGKIPGRISKSIKVSKDIDTLKEQLNNAIRNEEYEKAAEIRDKIKNLEGIGNQI